MVSAYQIGPLVLSAPRLYAALGLAVLVLAAEVVAWRRNRAAMPSGRDAEPPSPASASWAWNAAVAVVLGARMGFVLENLGAFLAQPLAMIQIWQGGFSPWWGVGAGVLVALRSVLLSKTPASVVVLPAALGLAAWLVVPALLSPAQQVDARLPSLVLERLEGGEVDLEALTGRPVVINLWATWCPPCRRELPMLAAAARANADVTFLLADQAEARAAVQAYLDRKELPRADVVLDGAARLTNEFGVVGLPTTLFFDATGRHVNTHAGELSSVMLSNYLEEVRRRGP